MGKRETEKEEKGRGRKKKRPEEKVLWWLVVGGQKGECQVGTMYGRVLHEKQYFHAPIGPAWDTCPEISKTRGQPAS